MRGACAGAVFILGYYVGEWNFLAGGRHAPNHPADRLRGTSRYHYLGGGLDEQPTLKLIPTTRNNDRGGRNFSGPLMARSSARRDLARCVLGVCYSRNYPSVTRINK